MNEILWCDQLNKASLAILSHGVICFSAFYKMKFGNLCQNLTLLVNFGSERVIMVLKSAFSQFSLPFRCASLKTEEQVRAKPSF